ncbi:chloride channel protein [Heterostelium album PN500]|uniref:Chloride channel protein n=1 Tax=Heterostelium pallidum (strain ATCC 26659 / Pp 5 / PN500) TaxID=670386 RepID=D3AZC2_HETP5|nr:chloride channel protein [Heterostelium album PN500]EFA85505.1 chloride channel protein [Heterostelium album PN500]|eukprot:XP_020437613.1 chloride channel protein [Heterostelium album PN500]
MGNQRYQNHEDIGDSDYNSGDYNDGNPFGENNNNNNNSNSNSLGGHSYSRSSSVGTTKHETLQMPDYYDETEVIRPSHGSNSYGKKSGITHVRGKHTFTEQEKEKMSQFESLDFPVIDNQIYRDFHKKSTRLNHILRTFGKWAICFMIGVGVGLIAYIVKQSVEFVQDFKFHSSEKYTQNGGKVIGFFVYYSINVLFGVLASLIIIPVGQIASGSGIPEVKGYLNGIRIPHSMNVRTLIGKTISLILAYSSGLILGPEGPMIHIGSMIGGAIGQVKSKTLKWYPKIFWRYHNDRDRRDFISTGAAAGVAAAFGAPIGGVLFGFEEASSFWSRQLTWRTFFACLIATFTTNIILQGFQVQVHDYGVLTFGFSQEYLYRYVELLAFAAVGVLGGLFGAFFVYLNARLSRWRTEFFSRLPIYTKTIEVFIIITLTSVVLFTSAGLTGCRNEADVTYPIDTITAQNITFVRFFCPEGQYNDMAGLSFNTLDASLRLLYSRSANLFSIQTLIVFTVISFILTTITSGIMLSSGLFIPMMLIGASLGRLAGQFGALMFKHANPPIDPSIYAMVGSSAMMAGFSRMTISLAIIIVELTEGTQYMLPVILSVMIAKWVGDIFNESIYEHLMEQKCYPFLPTQPPQSMLRFGITDVMKTDVVTLYEVERVSRIIEVLQAADKHAGFPVIEKHGSANKDAYSEDGIYCGMILRSQLTILLNYKIFCQEQPHIQNTYQRGKNQRRWGKATDYGHIPADGRMNYQIMTQALARHFPPISEMNITREEIETMYIDLRPYMNLSSVVANETFSFQEGYQLFRTMGLRHMPVVNKRNEVVGIVTRKDLL